MPRSSKPTTSAPKSTIPAPKPAISQAPAPKSSIQAPAPKSTIQAPSMMDTMKQGFSFGVGSAIAHNIMNSIFRPAPTSIPTTTPKESMHDLYNKCMEKNDSTVNCNVYLEKA
jgi:hypothetical protein